MKVVSKFKMCGVLLAASVAVLSVLAQGEISDKELFELLENAVQVDVIPAEPEIAVPDVIEFVVEEPVVEEELVFEEEPIVIEEPVVEEELVFEEEPIVIEEPVVEEELVFEEEPAAVEPDVVAPMIVELEVIEPIAVEPDMVEPVVVVEPKFVEPEFVEPEEVVIDEPLEQLISVTLNEVGLEEAISLFAQLSGANIIIPELTEASPVTVNLKDVQWKPALQSILECYNYELYQRTTDSNVYSVRRRPVGAPEPQIVETFKLNYATVPDTAELVRKLLPADAKVSEFASRNMIVVKTSESNLSELRAVLTAIDTVRQQVYIESKFMELSDNAQKDIGINWQSLSSYGVSLSENSAKYGRENITKFGSGGEITENLLKPLLGKDGKEITAAATGGEVAILTSVLDANAFSAVLSAMQQRKGINIVSNPKIIVANEEHANISIVRKEPNLKQERQQSMNENADTVTYQLDDKTPFFEYGIKLDVTPSINTASNITVHITPSLTRKEGEKKDASVEGSELLTYPIIAEKKIDTVFSLNSGQTAAIGGLTEATESLQEYKIPLLGDIPFLGRLFAWKQTVNGQNETIIFVTVGLANTQAIDMKTGLPEDTELARRRIISERNDKIRREQDRVYFEAQSNEELKAALKLMAEKEQKRAEKVRGNR